MKIIVCLVAFVATFAIGASTADAFQEQESSLKVGDKAPDFEVETFGGKTIKLSEQLKNDKPKVLVFSRAHW